MHTPPKLLLTTGVILLSLTSCGVNTGTEAHTAVPRGSAYCLVAKPIANSHTCPAAVQDAINEANATFYALCLAEK